MKASTQDYAHICVMTLSGEFTHDDTDAFHRALGQRLDSGQTRHVIIDSQHLEFIDSAGLETLINLQQRLAPSNGAIRIAQADDTIADILRLTRLESVLETCATIEDAVRSLR
ncbi:MAG: STAS domain-containing protein [Planctomycetota bacterium]